MRSYNFSTENRKQKATAEQAEAQQKLKEASESELIFMKKNRTRYFMTADFDVFRVEYVTKKEMISLMKDAKDSSYGNNNGFTDNYFDAVVVETKDYFRLSEEETAKEATHIIRAIERSRSINIVNENSECYIVYGTIEINEHGVVMPSETIADNIDVGVVEITEAEAEEIAEAERTATASTAEEAEEVTEEQKAEAFADNPIAEAMQKIADKIVSENFDDIDSVNIYDYLTDIPTGKKEQYYRNIAVNIGFMTEATAKAEAEEEQAEAMTASEIAEAKKAIDDYSFYHNACTVKTVRKHFLTAIAEQAEETKEAVKRYRNNVVAVCDMIIAEQAEQKKNRRTAKAVVTGVTAIYDFNTNTIEYSVNYSNNTVRDYATKTATASAFMATAKSFSIEAMKNNDSLTKAYVCYYATEEEAEEAEENNFNAILKAKAEAKRNNDSALNWKKYDYVNRSMTADIFVVHDIRRKTGTAEEQAEEEIERIKKMTEEAKQRKMEYEQRKIIIEQAKQAEAEIAEAIEIAEEAEILKKLAEQAEEEATKAIQNNLFNTASNFKKLAEQATEKASTRSEATAEEIEIKAIEEAIEEAKTIRYYAEASASAEEIEAIEAEIERLKNRKQQKLLLKDNNDFIEIAEAKEAEIAEAIEATEEVEVLKKLAEEAEEIAESLRNKNMYCATATVTYYLDDLSIKAKQKAEQAEQETAEAVAEQEQKKLLKLNMQYFAEASEQAEEETERFIVEIEYRNRKTDKFKYGIATKAEAFAIANSDIDNIYVTILNRYTEEQAEQKTAEETAEQAEEVTEQAEEATAEQKTAIIMLLLYWILSATASAEQKKQKLLKLNMQCFAYDYKAEYHKCIDIIKRISNFYLSTIHTEIIIQHFNCVYFNGFNIENHKLYDIYCAIKDFAYKFEYDRLIDNRYIRKCFTDLLNTFYNEIEAETAEEITVKISDIRTEEIYLAKGTAEEIANIRLNKQLYKVERF